MSAQKPPFTNTKNIVVGYHIKPNGSLLSGGKKYFSVLFIHEEYSVCSFGQIFLSSSFGYPSSGFRYVVQPDVWNAVVEIKLVVCGVFLL